MSPAPDFLVVHLLSLLRPPRDGALALDAGSGSGRNVSYLHEQGYRVVALDRVRRAALQQGPGGDRVQADLRLLPFVPGTFDVVLCDSVLDTWAGRESRCAVQELKQALRPGGSLLLILGAREGSDIASAGGPVGRGDVLGWARDLQVVELLYVRVDHPPAAGVRAQWALAARRRPEPGRG